MHRDDVPVGVGEREGAPERPVERLGHDGHVVLDQVVAKASMPPSAFSHSATPQPSGKEYRVALEAAFEGTQVRLSIPFSGLPIGKAMAATKLASD